MSNANISIPKKKGKVKVSFNEPKRKEFTITPWLNSNTIDNRIQNKGKYLGVLSNAPDRLNDGDMWVISGTLYLYFGWTTTSIVSA